MDTQNVFYTAIFSIAYFLIKKKGAIVLSVSSPWFNIHLAADEPARDKKLRVPRQRRS